MDSKGRDVAAICKTITTYLEAPNRPIGIKLYAEGEVFDESRYGATNEKKTYCRFVREAVHGKDFLIKMKDLDCVNAEVALGFREPNYVNIEPRIKEKIAAIKIGPVEDADVVMLVLNPEQIMIMSILLDGINAKFKGEMAVCGEATAHVHNNGQTNVTFLCNGARLYGGFEGNELVVGLPYEVFLELPSKMTKFASLSKKARDGFARLLLKIR